MTKLEWRQMILDLYHEKLSRRMRRRRRKHHPFECETEYLQDQLFRASRTIRFIDDYHDDGDVLTSVFQPEYLRSTLEVIKRSNQEVNEHLLVDSGMADILDEHFEDILSELEVSDLPEADIWALREAGSPNAEAELRRRIAGVKRHFLKDRFTRSDRMPLSEAVRRVDKEVGGSIAKFGNDEKNKSSSNEPPRKRWFKGLGSICRGTVLTAVDVVLLGGWFPVPLTPDTTIVGSVGSIVVGLGDIAVGIGELRGE